MCVQFYYNPSHAVARKQQEIAKMPVPQKTGLKSVGPRVRVRHAGQSRVSVPEMNWPRQTLPGFFLARVGRGTKIIARINTSSLPAADARQTVVPRWRITRARARRIAISLNSTSLFNNWSRAKREGFFIAQRKKAAPFRGRKGRVLWVRLASVMMVNYGLKALGK